MQAHSRRRRAFGVLFLSGLSLLPFGCKDTSPCDDGQESIGTSCFPAATGGGAGKASVKPESGAPAEGGDAAGGAASPPVGNPDATFGTTCQSDADCGGDAPICDTEMFHYCLQTECADGEANAGVCPEGWVCVSVPPHPSACINASAL
jgi:hypothetical protein